MQNKRKRPEADTQLCLRNHDLPQSQRKVIVPASGLKITGAECWYFGHIRSAEPRLPKVLTTSATYYACFKRSNLFANFGIRGR